MRSIVDTFNDTDGAKKNIYVRLISSGSIDQKVMLTVAAGVPPDIAGLFEINLVQFAASRALLPLDELAASSRHHGGHVQADFLAEPALEWSSVRAGEHAVGGGIALQQGRAGRSARRRISIAELETDAAALDRFGPDGRLQRVGFLPVEPLWYSDYCWMWFGGTHLRSRPPGGSRSPAPAVIAAFTWVQQDAKRWGADRLSEFLGGLGVFDSPTNGFLTGAVAMEQQGPWMASFIDRLKPGFSGLGMLDGVDDLNLPLAERQRRCQWAVAPFPAADPTSERRHLHRLRRPDDPPRGASTRKRPSSSWRTLQRQDVMERLDEPAQQTVAAGEGERRNFSSTTATRTSACSTSWRRAPTRSARRRCRSCRRSKRSWTTWCSS